jgi:MoaA/NifB/PqqE/SkfB family radical SAM enzyme
MKPILLHYYVTYRCNVRCRFCNIWDGTVWDHSAKPAWEDLTANIVAARKLGVKFVDFTGGEPLMYDELPDALRFAKLQGLRTVLTTNTMLYPKRAREIAGEVDLLHFSLDAADKEIHDDLRRAKVFDRVMESLDIAQSLGEQPDLLFTATSDTYRQIEPLMRMAQERQLVLIVNPEFSYFGNDGVSRETLDHIEGFAREPYVYVNAAFHRLIRRGGNDPRKPICRVAHAAIVVSPDNRMLFPCFHHQQEGLPINGRLEELFRGETAQKYRKQDGKHSFCDGCAINCYMDPSFNYHFDPYLYLSLKSKAKYAFDKYLRPRKPRSFPDAKSDGTKQS